MVVRCCVFVASVRWHVDVATGGVVFVVVGVVSVVVVVVQRSVAIRIHMLRRRLPKRGRRGAGWARHGCCLLFAVAVRDVLPTVAWLVN